MPSGGMIMKNLAKRLCALALCVLVCAVSALTVAAASETVKIKECDNLELKLPDNMSYVTRFSQTNDRYFTKNSLNTQGLGLILKYDFNTFRTLFRRKKKSKE